MEQTAPTSECYRFNASWPSVLSLLGVNAVAVVVGVALFLLGEWLLSVSKWLALIALAAEMIGGFLVLSAVCFGGLGVWIAFVRLLRVPVVRVTDDGLRIAHFSWASEFIPFADLKWAKREQLRGSVDDLLLVYGPDLKTESLGRREIGMTNFERLLVILAERCPAVFTPDPPAEWRTPC